MSTLRIRLSDASLGLAAFGLAASVATVLALAMPRSGFAGAFTLTPVLEARSDALARDARTSEPDRVLATLETRRSLVQSPANATAWLRLAYLDSLSPGGLSVDGGRAVARSYAAAPYGPDVTVWRLAFAFNHWSALSQETRVSVLEELRVTSGLWKPEPLRDAVSDPAGRVALLLTLEDMTRVATLGSTSR